MRVLIVEDELKMASLLRRGLVEEGHAADVAAHRRRRLVDGAIASVRGDRARRHAPRAERLRDLPAASECGRVGARPHVDRARRRRRPGRRAGCRGRRLSDEAVFVRRAACATPRPRQARRRRTADRADRRDASPRSRSAPRLARPDGDQPLPEGVRAAGSVHAPPRTGSLPPAVARACLGFRLRKSLERHRRLRALHP